MNHATEGFQPLRGDGPPMVAGYRLAARLGAGGLGRVYLSHTQGCRPVAIKVVWPELADESSPSASWLGQSRGKSRQP